MGHLVITIGCEYGAKGNAIGRKIAEDLGIKFYDRDLVDQIIEEVGIPKDIMNRVEEGGTIAGKGAEGVEVGRATAPAAGVLGQEPHHRGRLREVGVGHRLVTHADLRLAPRRDAHPATDP